MLTYKAPLRDIKFLINEVFDYPGHYQTFEHGKNADSETVAMILEGFADLAQNVIAPLYQSGDAEGCHFEDGKVSTPKGFKEAVKEDDKDRLDHTANPQQELKQALKADEIVKIKKDETV